MRYTKWLSRQVERLENEIRGCSVFETSEPASPKQLRELRAKVVIHTFIKQQLLRREVVQDVEADVDTQEFVLVRKGS
jgi:hypothetical protein